MITVRLFVFVSSFMLSASILAGEIRGAKISTIMMDKGYGPRVYLDLTATHTSHTKADCHDSANWEYVVDTGTPYGKQLFSVLLMVKAQDKAIKFYGTNTCLHTGIEELRRIEVGD